MDGSADKVLNARRCRSAVSRSRMERSRHLCSSDIYIYSFPLSKDARKDEVKGVVDGHFPRSNKVCKVYFCPWVSTMEAAAFPAWSWISDRVNFHRHLVSDTWFFYYLCQKEMRGKIPR